MNKQSIKTFAHFFSVSYACIVMGQHIAVKYAVNQWCEGLRKYNQNFWLQK